MPVSRQRSSVFEAVDGLLAEHAELERELADPAVHADQALARALGQRYAELTADRARPTRELAGGSATTSRPPASWPARTPSFAAEAERARRAPGATPRSELRQLLVPRDPTTARTSSWRSRPARAARSRRCSPATCCACTRATPSGRAGRPRSSTPTESDLGGYKYVTVAVKARGHAGRTRRRGALLKFEGGVHRVQRVPVDRVAGPHPHLAPPACSCCPRPRTVDVADRPERPAHRRLPLLRPGRPEREHHRLRRAHHPRARPASWSAARTRRASCRTGSRRCGSCAPGCSRGPGGGRRRGLRRPPLPGPHRRPLRADPHLQLSRRTGSPTTASATRPTTSTRCWTAPWTPYRRPASRPTRTRRLDAVEAG